MRDLWNKILAFFGLEVVRNRDAKGRYVKDNPKTKLKNEAYKTVRKPRKPRAKATRKPRAKKSVK